MRLLRAAIFAALFLSAAVGAAWAQDITLTSRDGRVEITGTFLGFDGEFYRVDTAYGELTVDGSGVLCEGPACPDLEAYVARLRVSGSATMGDVLLPALVEGFALRNGYGAERIETDATHYEYVLSETPDGREIGRFGFRATNTDEGFADLLADETDIVMALREVRPDELRRAADAGLGQLDGPNRSRVLALDAMVPVTAAGNPVRAISVADLARVFAGQISNWRALDGPDAPISLHLLDRRSGLAQAVQDRVMGPARLSFAPGVIRHPTNEALAEAVSRDPFAIGISSFSETGNTSQMTLTGPCGFTLRAERLTIKTEDYPLTAPMFLYLPARRLPKLARDFLTYTRSQPAQIVIRRAGFTDQAPEEIPISAQGDRFANAIISAGEEVDLADLKEMIGTLAPMRRLSTSFRFRAGSVRLDAQSRSNVQQLARALEAGQYDARTLYFVGFSDGQGPAAGNAVIAQQRADAVQAAVLRAAETANLDRVTIETRAYGEALPMACDDSAWGRQVNRRVEVWVR